MVDNNRPTIHKADKSLQNRVGKGALDEEALKKAQEVIEDASEDFEPLAMAFLSKLKTAIEAAQNNNGTNDELIHGMTSPVMELKANAKMFQYALVSSLANIMLGFLETIKDLDKDAIDIVAAHHQTLNLIIIKKMKGDGGAHGKLLQTELRDAVHRYFAKRQG
ncbi:MAG: hypothetical protein ACPG05_01825 [Bdellovibrionales bacterium]